MKNQAVKCSDCSYVFNKFKYINNGVIKCPFCKKKSSEIEFLDLNHPDSGKGYAHSVGHLKDLLEDLTLYNIKKFFNKDVKIIKVSGKKGNFNFKDKKGKKLTLEEVNDILQKDVVFQRWIYNIWMTQYR